MSAGQDRTGRERRISSRDNPFYKELLQLAESSRERKRRQVTVIEGVHLCEAYLDRETEPLDTVVSESAIAHPQVRAMLERLPRLPVMLSDSLFRSISAVEHGVGIAMLIDTPRPQLPERIDQDAVFLDRIQDPGNIGTILRTCAAAGVRTVFTAPGTVWCWSPKVLRAGMGAHFHLEIHESVSWQDIRQSIAVQTRATALDASTAIWDLDLRSAGLWLFGQEGSGLDASLVDAADQRVFIPQDRSIESLNVGVAAALCLYEQLRQRRIR